MGATTADQRTAALGVITQQLRQAIAAPKCHICGCLHKTVEALLSTSVGKTEMAAALSEARSVLQRKAYDCLGCAVCYPAIAANAFGEAFPEEGAGLDLCPTEAPEVRTGWPPLPGDYHVLKYNAPVAVCTLNSDGLASRLRDSATDGLAIVGTLHTENLGIERIIRNTLSNPNIRFLILCGEDTKQAVGHLPGHSLKSLFEKGMDEQGRVVGAMGRRPVLKNVTRDQVHAFLEQLQLVSIVGEQHQDLIARSVEKCRLRDPGPYKNAPIVSEVEVIEATEPLSLTLDEAGYFVVYPDRRKHRLTLEHYTNAGVLNCVIEGKTSGAAYATAIERKLITRLGHAAYLGRELARAERALQNGEAYVQDRAAGGIVPVASSCGCSEQCENGERA